MTQLSTDASQSVSFRRSHGVTTLTLSGNVTLHNSSVFEPSLKNREELTDISKLVIDVSGVQQYDSYIVAYITAIQNVCINKDISFEIVGLSNDLQSYLGLLKGPEKQAPESIARRSRLYRNIQSIGEISLRLLNDLHDFVAYIGELTLQFAAILVKPSTVRWKDFPFYFTRASVDAVFIVTLIGFLIGVIIGYQGAVQLRQFGADAYLADLVGISVVRELGPLITAIIVAGRSGSAFAAEIGTMQVSEEIDALKSMGMSISRFLVIPRILAVTLAMPLLTLFADAAGIVGGLLIGMTTLDATLTGYFAQSQEALTYVHVGSGLVKSVIFGVLIASVGCFRGLQVRGGAESVGKYTTAAVVSGIFLIIVADATFTFIFQALGI